VIQLTFAMIKSKAIRHNLHQVVLSRALESGFTIERAEWRNLSTADIERFYNEHQGKPYWDDLVNSVSGHVIVMALSRRDALVIWRGIMGATDPKKALRGTIRWLAQAEPVMADNIVHGSDSALSAEREIHQMFGPSFYAYVAAKYGISISDRRVDGA